MMTTRKIRKRPPPQDKVKRNVRFSAFLYDALRRKSQDRGVSIQKRLNSILSSHFMGSEL